MSAPTIPELDRRPPTVAPSSVAPSASSVPSVPQTPNRATYWRRRAVAVTILLVSAFVLTALIGRVGAEAELEDKVAGHVVVQPGQTLWDVAVDTAPDGVDPREQLRAVAELNGLDSSSLDAWSVILVPAR